MAVSLRRHSPKLITSCRRFCRTPNTHITPPQPFSLFDQLLQTQAPLLINMPIVCPKNGVCRPDSCQPSPPPLNLLTLFIDLTWFFPPRRCFRVEILSERSAQVAESLFPLATRLKDVNRWHFDDRH